MSLALDRAHAALQAALGPLGIEIGPEVLAVWIDRQHQGAEPLPAAALRDLAALAQRLLDERHRPTAERDPPPR